MLTEEPLCSTCSAAHRDSSLLCVVESPADVVAIEQSGSYRGRYFVLMGHLSPLDGIGPEQLDRFMSGNRDLRLATAAKIADVLELELRPVKIHKSKG